MPTSLAGFAQQQQQPRQLCLRCESNISWSGCDINTTYKSFCGGQHQRCAAVMEAPTRRDKIKYIKKCVSRLDNPCRERRREECRITFCEKDLCNFALTPTATLIASAFRCKQCESKISWGDCDNKAVEVFCGAGFRKCFKRRFTEDGVTVYSKGCTVPLACGDSQVKMPNNDQRNITCCGQHVCNMAERNGASVFLMGVLLLGSMIFTGTVVFHFRMK